MKSYGLTVSGEAKEVYFGQVSGGLPNQPGSSWLNEEKLKFVFDFQPLFGIKGLTIESNWRYRGGGNPQWAAGTPGNFNPTTYASGTGVRIMTQQIEYSTPNKSVTINAGWENPYEQFLQQPLSKFFENNSFTSSKGIGGTPGPGIAVVNNASAYNAKGVPNKGSVGFYKTSPVPWGSSYAAWGGTLKIRPTREIYVQSGLYLAISGTGGVAPTQYSATSVYPYTSVPQSYLGQFKKSGQVVGVVGGDGRIITGASQNVGWVPGSTNNHGLNFHGSPRFHPNTGSIGARPTSPANGKYVNAKGQKVSAPAYYAASPYNQGSGGSYNQNGLYSVNEIGWTPKFGKDKLEGKYAIGGYIWGQKNTSYSPTHFTSSTFPASYRVVKGKASATYPGNYTTPAYTSYAATKQAAYHENQVVWGLYLQADQQLYRVKEHVDAQASDGKSAIQPAKLSDKGLYMFNEFTFTPPQNNQLPFYFQTGLVYKGLLPHRDNDSVGVALGVGIYSSYYNSWLRSQNEQLQNAYGSAYNAKYHNGPTVQQPVNPGTGTGATPQPDGSQGPYQSYYAYQPMFTSTEVFEAFYNVQLNKWASVKPYAQFIINPAGNNTVPNDLILGVSAKVTF
ncbi:MAG: carbohydrate porin [Verrucomicrobiae bacterium]